MRLASLLLAGVSLLAASCGGEGGAAPSQPFGFASTQTGFAVKKAQRKVFTDGSLPLQNTGDRPVRIVDVELEDGAPGLELVGAMIAGLDRKVGTTQIIDEYPPRGADLGPLQEAKGFVIPAGPRYAGGGVELLLGIRKTVPGRATRRAVVVTYEVNGKRGKARFGYTLAVCDPASVGECPQEFGDSG